MPTTRSAALRIAAELPKGDPFRQRLLDVLHRTAQGGIGPFIRFNNKLWVDPFGYDITPREGSWTRLRLVNPKTGLPLKTEVEVTWGRPGELSVYESGRRQPRYKYEDVGLYAPPVQSKDVKSLLAQETAAKGFAKQVVEAAKAEGLGGDAAVGFARDVLSEVNWHSLARNVGGRNAITTLDAGDMAQRLDHGVEAAAALAWYVGALVGDKASTAAVEDALMAMMQEEKKHAIRQALR